MLRLRLEEALFVFASFLVVLLFLLDDRVDRFDLRLELENFLLLLLLSLLKLNSLFLQLGPAVLSLQHLAHGEGDRRAVEGLIGLDVRVDVPLDAQQEETALWAIQSHLPDDLFEALLK